jgi:hypothetical protein
MALFKQVLVIHNPSAVRSYPGHVWLAGRAANLYAKRGNHDETQGLASTLVHALPLCSWCPTQDSGNAILAVQLLHPLATNIVSLRGSLSLYA